jgi:hypothetical protein
MPGNGDGMLDLLGASGDERPTAASASKIA